MVIVQVNQLVLVALEAAKDALWSSDGGGNGRYGHRSFNLFGFDFMIDADFKVAWRGARGDCYHCWHRSPAPTRPCLHVVPLL